MITVSIHINDRCILARTAVRKEQANKIGEPTSFKYEVDDASILEHEYAKGAVPLAIQMLETITPDLLKG